MISITLNFKSIDAARAALLEIPQTALVGGPDPEVAAPAPKPVKAAKPAPEPVVAQPQATAAPVEAPAPAAAPAVEYPVLQKAVFALAGKNREAAAAVVAGFGVKTFKELPQDKWAEALAAVNAKLAEV